MVSPILYNPQHAMYRGPYIADQQMTVYLKWLDRITQSRSRVFKTLANMFVIACSDNSVYPHLPFTSPVELFLTQQNYYTTFSSGCQLYLAPQGRLELPTNKLTVCCSTTELLGNKFGAA